MRVLLVEDERDQLRLLQILVESAGHETLLCATARQAREARDWDLAFVDRHLPDGDGLELARSLSGHVYVITGDETVVPETDLHVLLKPIHAAELMTILAEHQQEHQEGHR